MRLAVLDASGRVVDTLSAGKRKGINRVVWSMQEKPPRVPTAAQAGGAGAGPRVLPGTYTVRLTKGKDVIETPLVVSLDPKAPFTLADRKAQYDAAMQAHALFGRMSDVVDRLNGYRALAAARAKGLPPADAVRKDLDAFAAKADAIRKDVVATSEGGAITGEERLREHLAYVYDAILSYEGRPGDYQVERVAVLERELKDVEARASELAAKDLPALNEKLKAMKLAPIADAAAREEGARIAAARTIEEAWAGAREGAAATRRSARD